MDKIFYINFFMSVVAFILSIKHEYQEYFYGITKIKIIEYLAPYGNFANEATTVENIAKNIKKSKRFTFYILLTLEKEGLVKEIRTLDNHNLYKTKWMYLKKLS